MGAGDDASATGAAASRLVRHTARTWCVLKQVSQQRLAEARAAEEKQPARLLVLEQRNVHSFKSQHHGRLHIVCMKTARG